MTNRLCKGLTAASLLLAGCGPVEPVTLPIDGRVSVDGKPLTNADITLFSSDNGASADAGEVRDGEFRFRAKPGPKRVEIVQTITQPDGSAFNPIPPRYNAQSKLKIEVSPNGENHFEFDLSTK